MTDISAFEIVAEIAMALIGFAGVVVVLGRSRLGSRERQFRLKLLFFDGTTALWGALTPTLASFFSPAHTWQVSAILFLPALVAVNVFAWANFFGLVRPNAAIPKLFFFVIPIMVVLLLFLLLSLIIWQQQIATAQFASVVFILFLGLYHFFVLVTSGSEADDT